MTGDEMAAIRKRMGLNALEFGCDIGYSGNRNTVSQVIRHYENGRKPIPPWIATTVRAMDSDKISDEIYAVVGELLTFEEINKLADHIVDHLVREEDVNG